MPHLKMRFRSGVCLCLNETIPFGRVSALEFTCIASLPGIDRFPSQATIAVLPGLATRLTPSTNETTWRTIRRLPIRPAATSGPVGWKSSAASRPSASIRGAADSTATCPSSRSWRCRPTAKPKQRPRVKAAGRIVSRRIKGKVHFIDLWDSSGKPTMRKTREVEGKHEATEFLGYSSQIQLMLGAEAGRRDRLAAGAGPRSRRPDRRRRRVRQDARRGEPTDLRRAS